MGVAEPDMSVVESLKQKEPLFSRRVQPDMPDGTIRHGAMLDYSCALVASERSQRNTVIATEKRKEEEKKITKEKESFQLLTRQVITYQAYIMLMEA